MATTPRNYGQIFDELRLGMEARITRDNVPLNEWWLLVLNLATERILELETREAAQMENTSLSQWKYTALEAEAKEEVDLTLRMAESGLRAALSRLKSYREGEPVLKIMGEFNSTARLLDDAVGALKSAYGLNRDTSSV